MYEHNSPLIIITSKGIKQACKKPVKYYSKRQKIGSKGHLTSIYVIIKVYPPPTWNFPLHPIPPNFQTLPPLSNPPLPPPCWYCTQAFKKVENWIWRDCKGSISSSGGFVFMEPEDTKVVDTYRLLSALANDDEVKTNVQKGSVSKDTSGPFECKSYHFSGSTKTILIQHGLKIFCQPKHSPFHHQICTHQFH